MKKLHVDQDKCVSCGACIAECALLQENDEGKAVPVSGGVITIEIEQSVMNAVENCPVNALQIKDESRTLEQIKEELNKPLEIPEVPSGAYQFNKENYHLPVMSGRGEYQYNYSSDDKAEREGLRDFRDNIYSQKKAIAQQVIASYKQEKLVPLMKYEEQAGNYLYETNKQLEEKLRSYVAEIEACLGKKFNKPQDFFGFATRHNKVIGWSTDYLDESLASSVANACESYDWFDCYVNSDDMIVGTKSYWYMDGDVDVYKYCYRLNEASEKLNQQILDECQSIVPERAKKQIESAMQFYYQDLDKEWREKVKIVKDVDNYIGSELDKCGNEVVAPIQSRNSVGDISENYHGGNCDVTYDENGDTVYGCSANGTFKVDILKGWFKKIFAIDDLESWKLNFYYEDGIFQGRNEQDIVYANDGWTIVNDGIICYPWKEEIKGITLEMNIDEKRRTILYRDIDYVSLHLGRNLEIKCKSGCEYIFKGSPYGGAWGYSNVRHMVKYLKKVSWFTQKQSYNYKMLENHTRDNIEEIYDENGWDYRGFNKFGFNRNNTLFDDDGYDKNGFDCDGYNKEGYDKNGYDRRGFDRQGIDKDGYNKNGVNVNGVDREDYNKEGDSKEGCDKTGDNEFRYDVNGFNADGYDRYRLNAEEYNNECVDRNGDAQEDYGRDGYNKSGYNRWGFDRTGYNRAGYDKDGFNKDGYNRGGYDRNGYDKDGYNRAGYNEDGYDKDGYKRNGYNAEGFDREGFDASGYNAEGYNKEGFDASGYNKEGYNKDGFDASGYDKEGYNSDGYDTLGVNKKGFDMAGINVNGTIYDNDGYDKDGYNKEGYDISGYNKDGYDKSGYGKDGYDKNGYDKNGYDINGFNKAGFNRDGQNMGGHYRGEVLRESFKQEFDEWGKCWGFNSWDVPKKGVIGCDKIRVHDSKANKTILGNALKLICQGKYLDEDIWFLRLSIDHDGGWALTKNSFCYNIDNIAKTILYKDMMSAKTTSGMFSIVCKNKEECLFTFSKDDIFDNVICEHLVKFLNQAINILEGV
ncbi:MAG: ferredoxin [Butyrivibrio sp.]|nr:ferredoxin [Butyrivibrio sp.]